jgi:tetratricopeptide (TPR) repeat protein
MNLLFGALFGTVILAVAAAFFTPVIAGFLAPILAPGLSGAAAVSAVLAALGGGAIAAGGFGMAGGFAVLVAGGAILGGGAGAGVGALFAQSPDTALTQAAKLEVVMKEIIFIQKDIRLAQEIIKEQRQAIRSIEDKLDDLLRVPEKNQKQIENLKKAIDYLKKALERNQNESASFRKMINEYKVSPVCSNCRHLNSNFEFGKPRRCKAFSIQIPNEIWKGDNNHRQPYPGDRGIQFESHSN